jgi:hypothetical protein
VLPSLVGTDSQTGTKNIMYNDVIAILTMTLQHELTITEQLAGKVEDHERRISALEESDRDSRDSRIVALETQVMELKMQLKSATSLEDLQKDITITASKNVSSTVSVAHKAESGLRTDSGIEKRERREAPLLSKKEDVTVFA